MTILGQMVATVLFTELEGVRDAIRYSSWALQEHMKCLNANIGSHL